jgi:hypothetical protein
VNSNSHFEGLLNKARVRWLKLTCQVMECIAIGAAYADMLHENTVIVKDNLDSKEAGQCA